MTKKSDLKMALVILGRAITIFIVACVVAIYAFLLMIGKGMSDHLGIYVNGLVSKNPEFFETTFTEIFPRAIACKKSGEANGCVTKIRREIEGLLTPPIPGQYYVDGYMWVNKPMYFITLKNGQIMKLFFSGGVKMENVNTFGELKVVALLSGWTNQLYDISLNDNTLPMTYLKDLYSEAEVIVPYKINGKTVGAIVYLHGD